jgi:hypothetical protein
MVFFVFEAKNSVIIGCENSANEMPYRYPIFSYDRPVIGLNDRNAAAEQNGSLFISIKCYGNVWDHMSLLLICQVCFYLFIC